MVLTVFKEDEPDVISNEVLFTFMRSHTSTGSAQAPQDEAKVKVAMQLLDHDIASV